MLKRFLGHGAEAAKAAAEAALKKVAELKEAEANASGALVRNPGEETLDEIRVVDRNLDTFLSAVAERRKAGRVDARERPVGHSFQTQA